MYDELINHYAPVFQDIADKFGCSYQNILIKNQFGEGRSGDVVLLICVTKALIPSDCGYYVLKIFTGDGTHEEIAKTYTANRYSEGEHILIPELQCFGLSPAYYVYDVAGDDFSKASSFSKMDPHTAGQRLEVISTILLSEWNEQYEVRQATLYSLLIEWIESNRLKSSSRLCNRIKNQIADELTNQFKFDGRYYPNPLFYLFSPDSSLNKGKAILDCALYGKVHGDLNMDNVIAIKQPGNTGYQFYLIDFDHYKNRAPLLFDHAYLLLCLLIRDAESSTLSEWCENIHCLFEVLAGSKQAPRSSKTPDVYIRAHADAIKQFIQHQQVHNRDAVMRQLLAAHVAVGLNFVNKSGSGDRQQKLALLYAATAMGTLLANLDVAPTDCPSSPELQIGQEGNSTLWRQVEHFTPENRYILLTSGVENAVSADQLINLAPINWAMILEVNQLLENPIRDQVLPAYKRVCGYRVYELPSQDKREFEAAPAWTHLTIPEGQRNPSLYYARYIQEKFRRLLKTVLSVRENEPLFIIADLSNICVDIQRSLVNDILLQAGENTLIRVICLGSASVELYSDEMIQHISSESSLAKLSQTVYRLRKSLYNPAEISIPHKDGIKRIPPEVVANLANDMVLVHRNIIYGMKDDGGEGFFHGNEASWLDIANGRDVIRLDYTREWKQYLNTTLEEVSAGTGTVVNLFHRAGGGGTTLAKRVAWDFCNLYPTVILRTVSDKTADRLKELYSMTIKPLLVIVEVSDGQVTADRISTLRRELISKNIRLVFLFVSRFIGRERIESVYNLYLPNTPELYMEIDEATDMLRQFSACLKPFAQSEEDKDDINRRIIELGKLTYDEEYAELRQPFFYGLYTYENSFHGVSEYVEHNSSGLNKNQQNTFNILAMITMFSQSINLSFVETALFLFPESDHPERMVEDVKDWMYSNDLLVRRDRGIRICHPIIAKEILKKNGLICKSDRTEDGLEGTDDLVDLTCRFVDCMVQYYGEESPRVNSMFHDVFTHRTVIYEEEPKKFSPLLTMLYTRERCIRLLSHVANAIPWNPHYRNHLARLYLYSVTPEQKAVYPEPDKALTYARLAIQCAEDRDGEGQSIHYHVLGKAFTKKCSEILRKSLNNGNGLSRALRESQNAYDSACNAFNQCIAHDKSGYGLTGKVELITNVLKTITGKRSTISYVLTNHPDAANKISRLLSEAGNVISNYIGNFDTSSAAFRSACMNFYSTIGNVERLELIFNSRAVSEKEQVDRNRALSAALMKRGNKADMSFSFDCIPENDLRRIFELMNQLVAKMSDNEQDRFRWLETYRRLPEFELERAYQFLMEWPKAESNMYVCYYRYIIAFLIYSTTGKVNYDEVRLHLDQTESLSRSAYGKSTTTSFNYYGTGERAVELLKPRNAINPDKEKSDRIEQNKEYRTKYCRQISGRIEEVEDNLITIRFHIAEDDPREFLAKTPNVYQISQSDEGFSVKFYIGFSYSGIRAWDVVLDDPLRQQDQRVAERTEITDFCL